MPAITRPMVSKISQQRDLSSDARRAVGARLRAARLDAHMTQLEVSRLLGIGETTISALESGRISVSPQMYADLGRIFDFDRTEWGTFLLRNTNPWLYLMIFGTESLEDARLAKALKQMAQPERLAQVRGKKTPE